MSMLWTSHFFSFFLSGSAASLASVSTNCIAFWCAVVLTRRKWSMRVAVVDPTNKNHQKDSEGYKKTHLSNESPKGPVQTQTSLHNSWLGGINKGLVKAQTSLHKSWLGGINKTHLSNESPKGLVQAQTSLHKSWLGGIKKTPPVQWTKITQWDWPRSNTYYHWLMLARMLGL